MQSGIGASHWKRTVSSDESRFNLDGPYGQRDYWRDKRSPVRYVTSRRNSGGSVFMGGKEIIRVH